MIKAVIFDYGNVISALDNSIFLKAISRYSCKTVSELHSIIYETSGLPVKYETGHITSDDFFTKVSHLCSLTIDKQDFITAFTRIFTPIPETLELIKALKPHYMLALLSNTNEWDYTYEIQRIPVFDLFDTVTVSYRVKAMKPDRAIYLDALNKLQLEPDECIYIDDIQEYADAAAALGINGIHYRGHGSLLNSLSELGCNI